ncbi:unnamed protein product [Urochloa humidicola]
MAASYSIAPVQSELKMTLYNKEVYSGRETNGVTTLVNGGPIGTTWVFSWPVTDGPAGRADANIVGYLQGTGVQVATSPNYMWHYSLGLVFGQKSRYLVMLDINSKKREFYAEIVFHECLTRSAKICLGCFGFSLAF